MRKRAACASASEIWFRSSVGSPCEANVAVVVRTSATKHCYLELANAVCSFGLFAWKFGLDWALPAFCVLGAGLVGLSVIDLHTKRLPREIIYITAAIGVPLLCLAALVRHEPRRMWMMLLGAAIALAFMGPVYVASRGGMGDGDVRLSPLLGAYLGWLNPGIVAGRAVPRVLRRRGRRRGDDGQRPRRTKDGRAVRAVPGRSARSSPCSSVSAASTIFMRR